ncbi:glycosyltransferase [Candidatus Gottesmanbacteria bacterium]|nr:glycosyltransferase [Candidatus Gottesmanbacteria bacterium]
MKRIPPLISVIIPAYNEQEQLPKCLQSLKNQKTSLPFEVIVIDNNSRDNTINIAKSFGVKTLIEKIRGRSHARQKGAMAAKGKYLVFTEADCEVPHDWLQSIYDYYNINPFIIGFAGGYTYKNSTLLMKKLVPLSMAITSFLYKLIYGNHTFRGTNFTIQKKFLLLAGGFNHFAVPFDDIELGLRAGKLGLIRYNSKINVVTSDRRIKKRFFTFCLEFIRAYSRIFIFNKKGFDLLYEDIRN